MLNLYNTIKIYNKNTDLLILKNYFINEMFIYIIFLYVRSIFYNEFMRTRNPLLYFSKIVFHLKY